MYCEKLDYYVYFKIEDIVIDDVGIEKEFNYVVDYEFKKIIFGVIQFFYDDDLW